MGRRWEGWGGGGRGWGGMEQAWHNILQSGQAIQNDIGKRCIPTKGSVEALEEVQQWRQCASWFDIHVKYYSFARLELGTIVYIYIIIYIYMGKFTRKGT